MPCEPSNYNVESEWTSFFGLTNVVPKSTIEGLPRMITDHLPTTKLEFVMEKTAECTVNLFMGITSNFYNPQTLLDPRTSKPLKASDLQSLPYFMRDPVIKGLSIIDEPIFDLDTDQYIRSSLEQENNYWPNMLAAYILLGAATVVTTGAAIWGIHKVYRFASNNLFA